MAAPQDHDQALPAAGGTARVLIESKKLILEQFRARVRTALPSARYHPGSIIIDTLPAFLTCVARASVIPID